MYHYSIIKNYGELIEEVECFKYLGSKVTVDGAIETEVKSRISDVGKVFICRTMDGNECTEKAV